MQALKTLQIGNTSAFRLLAILFPTTIVAVLFFGSFLIATPESLRFVFAGLTLTGMVLLAVSMMTAAATIYAKKR